MLMSSSHSHPRGPHPHPHPPSCIGTKLEVCYRHWRKPTAEEVAKGEKRKKIGVKIWCEGTVTQIANGTTDKASARCTNVRTMDPCELETHLHLTPLLSYAFHRRRIAALQLSGFTVVLCRGCLPPSHVPHHCLVWVSGSQVLAKGALRIHWPEDKDRGEKESYSWHMFQDADWRKDAHLGWRYAESELQKRAECAAAAEEAGPAHKRRK